MGLLSKFMNINRKNRIQKKEKFKREIERKAYDVSFEFGELVDGISNLNDFVEDFSENVIETVDNALTSSIACEMADKVFNSDKSFFKGDHLYIYESKLATRYTHHGIYIGYDKVIEYCDKRIRIVTLERFSNNKVVFKKSELDSPAYYPSDEILKRAFSRQYEKEYNLIFNNCENFVRWARAGSRF